MARTNRTSRRPQRLKHRVEDAVARRALHREVERSYREEAVATTYDTGRVSVLTFTDPSFAS